MDGKHSRWSASTARRWINCAGSLNAIDALPAVLRSGRSSTFAEQGTAAHFVADTCLKNDEDADKYANRWVRVTGQGEHFIDGLPEKGEYDGAYEVDGEMVDGVQLYLDTVRADLRDSGGSAVMTTEETADLSWLRPGMFGTRDSKVSEPFGLLRIYDLKYGRGVFVDVVENEQEMYYSLPDVRIGDYSEVELVVVQPRCPGAEDDPPGVRRWRTTPAKLMAWAEELGLAVDRTIPKDAPRTAGDWCGWCPVGGANLCPEKSALIEELAGEDFADMPEDAPTELIVPEDMAKLRRAFLLAKVLENHASAINATVDKLLRSGMELDFAKLVRKKTNRAITVDEETWVKGILAAAKKLKQPLKKEQLYSKPKLLGPAPVEKLLPKKALVATVAAMVAKPEGSLTVALMSDERPAVSVDPGEDFSDDGSTPDLGEG